MANEHIGRLEQIGLGLESTPGTGVAPTVWLPKVSAEFNPVSEKAVDDSAYGVIDEVFDSITVKNMTEINFQGIFRDTNLGLLLFATMGLTYVTVELTLSGISGGTPAVGDSVSVVSPAMTGTLRYIAGGKYYVEVATGTLLETSNTETLTDGVWSGTISLIDDDVYTHVFSRLNTNNPPALSVTGHDPVDIIRATYGIVDSLEIEAATANFVTYNATLKAKKIEATTGTPVYTADNAFLGKQSTVKFNATFAGLDGASAVELSRIKVNINKNVIDYQALGSDDVDSLHNQQFNVSGDLEALFNSETFRDYMIDSTKQAMRIEITNTDVTIGTSGNPKLQIDVARQSFKDWGRSTDNNGLVTQSMGFDGEFDVSEAMTVTILLTNAQATAYDA